ncbi:electron transfer flavoprotein subunit alpha/FixB family protein [Paenibacillus sp. MMS18-CY102]|uniref:electron transfer flavoprotein subunit alpha/FixB family protein n=1 Tax=Paenibacillus sp. MMS18-CY102 TaxID=2682849 RepID=UPI001365D3CF|nr:electron transfer flavoprotein subunit alpha/FixB family protein [Paenibacillus sp. MMS18-CY102]MWC27760.1 electron transfer flavoprotein subunit alpha/FixB family protein [Paenibacillus sp. MMS18-CY102]
MSLTCLVYAESKDGRLRRVTLEALGAARLLAGDGGTVHAVIAGTDSAALAEAAAELAARGAAVVHIADDPTLHGSAPEAVQAVIAAAIEAVQPSAVLLGHTALGREVAPRVAAAIGAAHIADVTAIEHNGDGGDAVFVRPLYAGKAVERLRIMPGAPAVLSVRPNNLPPAEVLPPGVPQGSVAPLAYRPPTLWTVVRSVVRKASGGVDLAEADVIVSGGRGVRSAEGFAPLQALASLLGGAVGASRGACDAGYCDYALQIGQTGKVVTPQLYIACGISGAIQHLAGMSSSRVIVAVNKDAEAPIFGIADYGIVGDLFEIIPLLTAEFRRSLGNGAS